MILRFYDVSTGPTQPWCSTSQEQQPAGSHHPESRSREVTMPRPMAVRCCAVSSQGLAATLSCAAGFALCDAHCGCSGGVGSMVRVWGAMAPARFVLFLLLMAMCFRETCAAPWRAPGAGDELGAPFPDDRLDPDFVPVPLGQPRGPAGESAEQNPASEPEGDAGDVTGGGDPGSALSSGTETPADRMGVPPGRALPGHVFPPALEPSWNPSGPEKGKDEPKRGEYSPGLIPSPQGTGEGNGEGSAWN
ncbi:collagen alpha-1(I) chain-like isoform X2 [Gallus gallus]|uniref:collagen alpha-1(I) chain-like isoform X2 n=1 Tax=Gallus gallus TaxID=9031 RepID=UPI001AE19661|nr:collagen alpha-1(I) chain-like isoform X2 [Gallus gallus]